MKKEEIIERSLDLFVEKGSFKNVTMDEIASELSISKRTLYENFENKKNLVLECLRHVTNSIYQECEHLRDKSQNAFDYFFKTLNIIQSSFKEVASFSNELKKTYPDVFKQIISSHIVFAKTDTSFFFNKAKQEGFIREDIDEEFFISLMEVNMYNISNSRYLLKNEPNGQEIVRIKIFYTIMRGISSVKGVEYIDNLIVTKN
jgi:AcrR family transcriptional regulator